MEREKDMYFQELVGVVRKDRTGLGYNSGKSMSEREIETNCSNYL